VADADQRELYISLGSALENLLLAAEHFGYSCRVTYLSGEKDLVATVNLNPIDISMPPGRRTALWRHPQQEQ
jgi:nitroreductase